MEIKSWEYLDPVESLAHYGIKGMKWGIVRTPEELRSNARRMNTELRIMEDNYANATAYDDYHRPKEEEDIVELEEKAAKLEAKANLLEADIIGEKDEVKAAKAREKAAKYRAKAAKYRKKIAKIKTAWAKRDANERKLQGDITKYKSKIESYLKTADAIEDGSIERGHSIITQHFMKYK